MTRTESSLLDTLIAYSFLQNHGGPLNLMKSKFYHCVTSNPKKLEFHEPCKMIGYTMQRKQVIYLLLPSQNFTGEREIRKIQRLILILSSWNTRNYVFTFNRLSNSKKKKNDVMGYSQSHRAKFQRALHDYLASRTNINSQHH